MLPEKLPQYHRQQRLLEYSSVSEQDDKAVTRQRPGQQQCGVQMTASKRVVGGDNAGFGEYPWMALVKGSQAQCGGALVGDRLAQISQISF